MRLSQSYIFGDFFEITSFSFLSSKSFFSRTFPTNPFVFSLSSHVQTSISPKSFLSSHITSADHRPLSPSPSVHHQPTTILSTIAHHPSSPILVIMRLAPTPPTITMSPLCHLRRSSMLLEIWFSTFLFFPFHLFNLVHGDHFLPLLYCSESVSE